VQKDEIPKGKFGRSLKTKRKLSHSELIKNMTTFVDFLEENERRREFFSIVTMEKHDE